MKINLNTCAILKKFKYHEQLKPILLKFFKEEKKESTFIDKFYSTDNISNLDWKNSTDFKRKWVVLIYDKLINHFIECGKQFNYKNVEIYNLWFQQYLKGDSHGWHIHGANYTGVYYVEFSNKATKTELIDHSEKKIIIEAKEGDIVIFPSFIIHRSPKILSNIRKTIISFNINFLDLDKSKFDYFEKII
jgi:hypothetical protein